MGAFRYMVDLELDKKEKVLVKLHEVPLTAPSVLCITAINPITTQLKQRNPVPAVQINRTPTVAS